MLGIKITCFSRGRSRIGVLGNPPRRVGTVDHGRVSALVACAAMIALAAGCASPKGSSGGSGGNYEENAVVHTASPAEIAATRSREPMTADAALLYVNGLGCPLCATNIDMQLLRLRGVESATVNLGNGTVLVTLGGGRRPSPHDFSETVLDAGFTLVKVEPR